MCEYSYYTYCTVDTVQQIYLFKFLQHCYLVCNPKVLQRTLFPEVERLEKLASSRIADHIAVEVELAEHLRAGEQSANENVSTYKVQPLYCRVEAHGALVERAPFDHRDAGDSGEQRSLDARLVRDATGRAVAGASSATAVGERAECECVVCARAAGASVELRRRDLDGACVEVDEVVREVQAPEVRAGHVHDALRLAAPPPLLLLLLASYSCEFPLTMRILYVEVR